MLNPRFLREACNLRSQGFILIEVLIAILAITMFVAVTMQAMTIAIFLKARAQAYTQAIIWIQQDLESGKQIAASYQYTSLSADAAQNASSINLTSATDFANNDTLIIGTDATIYKISSINGNLANISPLLQTNQSASAPVVVTTKCQTLASTPTTNAGFAAGIQDKITGSTVANNSNSVNFLKTSNTNQQFIMTRTTTVDSTSSPYKVLQIDYTVTPTYDGSTPVGNPVAKIHAEVIPNAAIFCP